MKFVVSMRDTWVVQWYCIFGGIVKMSEVVGMELYSKLFLLDVGNRVELC